MIASRWPIRSAEIVGGLTPPERCVRLSSVTPMVTLT